MKSLHPLHPRLKQAWRSVCCSLFAGSLAVAQTSPTPQGTPATPATPPPPTPAATGSSPQAGSTNPNATATDSIVQLSPFEVTTEADRGYRASNTLSGARFNTRIEDIGASLTVVTKEQLLDTAAIDLNDVFLYEASTEGIGNFTAFAIDRNGNVDDQVQRTPTAANRIRGLGAANTSRDNYPSLNRIPADAYNIDSLEISRGPNSNLFGLGGGAGTVNLNIARVRLNRVTRQVSLRVDDLGGFRSTLDLNQPIITDKLGVRYIGLYDAREFERKPSHDIHRRHFLAATYRPLTNTTIKATYEHLNLDSRRPNALTPQDLVNGWIASGSPTWDPVTFRARVNGTLTAPIAQTGTENTVLPEGLSGDGSLYTRPSMFIEPDGRVGRYTEGRLSGIPRFINPAFALSNVRLLAITTPLLRARGNAFPLFTGPGVSNRALYDWEEVNFQASNSSRMDGDIFRFEVEQRIGENLFLRGGWYREDTDNYTKAPIGGGAALQIDPNERLADGSANPYFLRPFFQAVEPTSFDSPQVNDVVRAELAYDFDLTKNANRYVRWLGRHRLGGYFERRRVDNATFRFRDIAFEAPPVQWTNAANLVNGNTANRVTQRYYVGDNQGFNIDAAPALGGLAGVYPLQYFDPVSNSWVNENVELRETAFTSFKNRQDTYSRGAVAQNFFFRGRLVTTFGIRDDFFRSRNTVGTAVNPATGFYDPVNLNNWEAWQESSGRTKTAGAVIKVFPWLGLMGNTSDTFTPIGPAVDNFGESIPTPTSEGRDLGFWVKLFRDKLDARVTWYKVDELNTRSGDAGIVAQRASRLDVGNDSFNFTTWATGVATSRLGSGATPAQIAAEAARITQLPAGFPGDDATYGATSDSSSRGTEFEINYNPTNAWTIKFTAARQKVIDTNISPAVQQWLDLRLPVWLAARDDAGNAFWTSNGSNSPQAFYNSAVLAPLRLATAQEGKSRSQVKEWSWRALSTYNFYEGPFKGLTVGGSVRWDDRGAIGYLGAAPDPDGVIRNFDINRPVYDPARTSFDFWAGYRFTIPKGDIRARVQLNVRDAFENGEIRAVRVNPDGNPSQYRIIDGRQFLLTTTFDF
jgi:hypothetical protein